VRQFSQDWKQVPPCLSLMQTHFWAFWLAGSTHGRSVHCPDLVLSATIHLGLRQSLIHCACLEVRFINYPPPYTWEFRIAAGLRSSSVVSKFHTIAPTCFQIFSNSPAGPALQYYSGVLVAIFGELAEAVSRLVFLAKNLVEFGKSEKLVEIVL
jgi:hypothetical protein